jgi:DNA-binding transcriptional LysR family regulator
MEDHPDAPTLHQLEVFATVAQTGSFSAAARQLGRAQSAVSHAMASLEAALGLTLFDRDGHRPVLTDAGRSLLQDTRAITGQVERLLGRALALRRKVEPEVLLVVDVMFPLPPLLSAIGSMLGVFPEVGLKIRSEALGAVAEMVLQGEAHVGVCPALDASADGLDRQETVPVELVAVAARSHPLAQQGPLTVEHLAQHVQIVLSTRASRGGGPDRGVFSPRTWRVEDLPTRLALIRAGFGWANAPSHLVEEDLRSGVLVPLQFQKGHARHKLPMVVITRRASPPGPAGSHLVEHLWQYSWVAPGPSAQR